MASGALNVAKAGGNVVTSFSLDDHRAAEEHAATHGGMEEPNYHLALDIIKKSALIKSRGLRMVRVHRTNIYIGIINLETFGSRTARDDSAHFPPTHIKQIKNRVNSIDFKNILGPRSDNHLREQRLKFHGVATIKFTHVNSTAMYLDVHKRHRS
jgi:hypothetical protein